MSPAGKVANALSLNAGMSAAGELLILYPYLILVLNVQCYGHNIGGFEDPQPSPELLVRWIQLRI